MINLLLDILLKCVDIFVINAKYKSKIQKAMINFMQQHEDDVKNNVGIKRRYDEALDKLRKEGRED
jgi:hypothetical protein